MGSFDYRRTSKRRGDIHSYVNRLLSEYVPVGYNEAVEVKNNRDNTYRKVTVTGIPIPNTLLQSLTGLGQRATIVEDIEVRDNSVVITSSQPREIERYIRFKEKVTCIQRGEYIVYSVVLQGQCNPEFLSGVFKRVYSQQRVGRLERDIDETRPRFDIPQ